MYEEYINGCMAVGHWYKFKLVIKLINQSNIYILVPLLNMDIWQLWIWHVVRVSIIKCDVSWHWCVWVTFVKITFRVVCELGRLMKWTVEVVALWSCWSHLFRWVVCSLYFSLNCLIINLISARLWEINTNLAARSVVNRLRSAEWMLACLLKERSTEALVGGKFCITAATLDSSVMQQTPVHHHHLIHLSQHLLKVLWLYSQMCHSNSCDLYLWTNICFLWDHHSFYNLWYSFPLVFHFW